MSSINLDSALSHFSGTTEQRRRRVNRATLLATAGLLVIIGAAGCIRTNVVVTAHGKLRTANEAPPLIYAEGGRVSHIAVHLGQHVSKGDVLVEFASTKSQSDLDRQTTTADALRAQEARLAAIVEGHDPSWPDVDRTYLEAEKATYKADSAAWIGEQQRLAAAVSSSQDKLVQLAAQEKALASQVDRMTKAIGFNVSQVQLDERTAQLAAVRTQQADERGKLADSQAKKSSALADRVRKAAGDLTEVRAKLSATTAAATGASVAVNDTKLLAGYAGTIKAIKVAEGSTVAPSGAVIEETPDGELIAEVRIDPAQMEGVVAGMRADIRVSAYDWIVYGRLHGKVLNVSADSFTDERTGQPYYLATVSAEGDLHAPAALPIKLASGTSVDVDLEEGRRSLASYILWPARHHLDRAFTDR